MTDRLYFEPGIYGADCHVKLSRELKLSAHFGEPIEAHVLGHSLSCRFLTAQGADGERISRTLALRVSRALLAPPELPPETREPLLQLPPTTQAIWAIARSLRATASAFVTRLLRYFRYELGHWDLDEQGFELRELQLWMRKDGVTEPVLLDEAIPDAAPQKPGAGRPFERDHVRELTQQLDGDQERPLDERLWVEAHAALLRARLPEAVLLAALSCEIGGKRLFFPEAPSAQAGFAMVDPRARLPVLDLIERSTRDAAGRGFSESEPKTMLALRQLFECRNNLLQGGSARFREQRSLRDTRLEDVETWLAAVRATVEWLDDRLGAGARD